MRPNAARGQAAKSKEPVSGTTRREPGFSGGGTGLARDDEKDKSRAYEGEVESSGVDRDCQAGGLLALEPSMRGSHVNLKSSR